MPIPSRCAVKAEVDFVVGFYQFVRESRAAAGTEDRPALAKGIKDIFVPPAWVTELHDVAPGRIELVDDPPKAGTSVMEARRKLKKKAAHTMAKQVGNVAEIADESSGADETPGMSD